MNCVSHKDTVLVVDDHEPLLQAVCEILEQEGYTVSLARDGLEALRVMENERPDLIVADIMMPCMDGYAFYEAVRARPEWTPIPFIFLTARAGQEDVLKGMELGAEDYQTKPFDPRELLVVVRSRLKRAQAIQQAQGIELDQLKGQIVTALNHELRTPVHYVRGYAELALQHVATLDPEELQEFLLGIKRGADRLTRLVEDFLLLVQLDAGWVADQFEMLAKAHGDLDDVLRHVVLAHEERATGAGVELEVRAEATLPAVRLCKPLFGNALDRLVDNGIKFSSGAGKRVTVSARAVNGTVEIAVQDEGVGIPADQIPHLFERFRQIDRARMEQQGLGLGLAIARELIQLHGGDILVQSEPKKGSVFTIRLPAAGG